MRRSALLIILAVAACSKPSDQAAVPADTAAVPATLPHELSLADVKGTWKFEAMPENSDSVLTRYTLWASEDTIWKMLFDGRSDTLTVHVLAVAGDSIVTHVNPYISALRKGVTVEAHSVYRLLDGDFVGKSTARYSVKTADSVRHIRTHGTRAP
ncbi:MAG TPA: hypothetical protein VM100_14290 [Longimicrobiales bacterium]|nr:hypothetical protein [Longimicrobiales bacterium]